MYKVMTRGSREKVNSTTIYGWHFKNTNADIEFYVCEDLLAMSFTILHKRIIMW